MKIEKDERNRVVSLNGIAIRTYCLGDLMYVDDNTINGYSHTYVLNNLSSSETMSLQSYFLEKQLFYDFDKKDFIPFAEKQETVPLISLINDKFIEREVPVSWIDDRYVKDGSYRHGDRFIDKGISYEIAPNVFILNRDKNKYTICSKCGSVIRTDYESHTYNGKVLCSACYCDDNARICDYHTHKCLGLKRFYDVDNIIPQESDFKGYGIELETELKSGYSENYNQIKELKSIMGDHIYYERDGSVYNGFEHITRPHTYEAFLQLNWKDYLQKLIDMHYRSHIGGRCGYHIHASRTLFGADKDSQDNAIAKLMCFYAMYKYDIIKFSRRNNFGYCSINGVYNNDKDISLEKVKNSDKHRYEALNLCNKNTVEFRIARGTLKYETFIATFKFTAHLVKKCTELDWDSIADYHNWLEGLDEDTLAYLKKRHCFNLSTSTTNPRNVGEM